jgi:hypothetical protein
MGRRMRCGIWSQVVIIIILIVLLDLFFIFIVIVMVVLRSGEMAVIWYIVNYTT